MGALVAVAVLAVIGFVAPWRVALACFAVGASVILVLSGGSLTHW